MVTNDEIIKRLKIIRYKMHEAVNLHDRASLNEAYDDINKLLNDLGIELPDDSRNTPKEWID